MATSARTATLLALAALAAPAAGEPAAAAIQPRAATASSALPERILRRMIGEIALAQVERLDPAWEDRQRDCAGLIRFAYRTAFARLAPERVAAGLFRDAAGAPAHFADAGTLLRTSFAPLGRDGAARARLRSGDLLAFAREEDGRPVLHLMLAVLPDDPAHGQTLVVYHPGERGAAVRSGRLDALLRDAPGGWRPAPENPLFLGFYRLQEWIP